MAGKSAAIHIKILADATDFSKGADHAAASAGRMQSSMLTAGGVIAGAAMTGAAAMASIGAAAVSTGIQTAAGLEQASIGFTTMLGSAEKAGAFLDDLAAFAAATPFELPDLQEASSSLISIGVDAGKVIPIMRTLGDVTAGMGTGSEGIQRATVAIQQMIAANRITGEDLNQLRDAGIPVYDLLASATGRSKAEIVKLAQAGKLGKDELTAMMDALASGEGLKRFTGLMEKQATSLTGLWSTLTDTFSMGMATAVQPLIPLIKDGLGGAISWLADTTPVLATGISSLVAGFQSLGSGASPVMDTFMAIGTWITTYLVPGFTEVGTSIQGFVAVALPIVMDFAAQFTAAIQPMLPTVQEIFGQIGSILQSSLMIISGLIQQATSLWSLVWNAWGKDIVGAATWAIGHILGVIQPALGIIQGIFDAVTAAMRGDWSGVWSAITSIGASASKLVSNIVSSAMNGLKGLVEFAWKSMSGAIMNQIGIIVGYVKDIPGKIIRALGPLGSLLEDAGKAIMRGFLNGLKAIWDNIQGFVGGIGQWIKDHKGPLPYDYKLLQPAGRAIMGGFLDSLSAGMGGLHSWVGDVESTLLGAGGTLSYGLTGAALAAGSSGASVDLSGMTVRVMLGTREISDIVDVAISRQGDSLMLDAQLQGV